MPPRDERDDFKGLPAMNEWSLPLPLLALFTCVLTAAALAGALLLNGTEAAFGAILAAVALYVAAVDIDRFEIPDIGSAAMLVSGIVWSVKTLGIDTDVFSDIATRVLFAAGLLFALRTAYRMARNREGLGLGDVKLAGAGASWLSFSHIPLALFAAASAAILLVVLRRVLLGEPIETCARIPFGAFLAPAIWGAWVTQVIGV